MVLIFVGAVIASLLLSFYVTSLLYRNQVQNMAEASLIANGKNIIQTFQSIRGADLVPFMQGAANISNNAVQVYGPDGSPLLSGPDHAARAASDDVAVVLSGGIARAKDGHDHLPAVGLPFAADGQPHALFVALKNNVLWDQISKAVRTVLVMVLFFGSLLILAAARYIVKPLRRLTEATKRMAQGRFDVAIRTKRKDEIGQLTVSFNEMAGELEKLDRMRQDFVANVSHEIQSPLTSITGFTKALKQKKMTDEDRQHYLTIIEEESERLSRLTQNLLQLSSLQNESRPVNPDSYRLDEQIRKAVIAMEPQWLTKAIEIDLELEPLIIEADEDQLSQVWTNLLGNGIKYTPERGRIRIRASVGADRVSITIADNGIGIAEEERSDIFKPFYTVEKSRNRAASGNGLGLSIAQKIVELHHGNITIDGRPGAGTEVTVHLPLAFQNP